MYWKSYWENGFCIKRWRKWRPDGCYNLSWTPVNEQQLFHPSLFDSVSQTTKVFKSLSLSSCQVLSFMRSGCFHIYLVGLRIYHHRIYAADIYWKPGQTKLSNNQSWSPVVYILVYGASSIIASFPTFILKMPPSFSLLLSSC